MREKIDFVCRIQRVRALATGSQNKGWSLQSTAICEIPSGD
jgi:hypothetical protein